MDVNINGVFYGIQAASKYMLAKGKGSVIITSSMSGHIANRPQLQCGVSIYKRKRKRKVFIIYAIFFSFNSTILPRELLL